MAGFRSGTGFRSLKGKIGFLRLDRKNSVLSFGQSASLMIHVTRAVPFYKTLCATNTIMSKHCPSRCRSLTTNYLSCLPKTVSTASHCRFRTAAWSSFNSNNRICLVNIRSKYHAQRDLGIYRTHSLLTPLELADSKVTSGLTKYPKRVHNHNDDYDYCAGPGLCCGFATVKTRHQLHVGNFMVQCRGFKTKTEKTQIEHDSDVEDIIKMLDDKRKGASGEPDPKEFASGWLIRLANENGYLSWCRNSYIATIVGVTVYVQEPVIPYAKEVSFVFLLIGAVNMLAGTGTFIHNIVHLRRRLYMSSLSMLYHVGLSCSHLLLWLFGVILYIGYVEEEKENCPEDDVAK